jgi:phage tail sheath protein FI
VYVEEISRIPSIQAADTAVPAFIGYTQKAQQYEVGDLLFTPTRVTSMPEFESLFGTPVPDSLTVTLEDHVDLTASGTVLPARKISVKPDFLKNCLHCQLQLYFANGGGPCYIVSTGKPKSLLNKRDLLKGLDEIYNHRDTTIIVFPDAFSLNKPADIYAIYAEALSQAAELKDRFVIVDTVPADDVTTTVALLQNNLTTFAEPAVARYGAAYFPMLVTTIPYHYSDNTVKIVHDVIRREAGKADTRQRGNFDKLKLTSIQSQDEPLYNAVKNAIQQQTYLLPPSAAVAGVYAQVDGARGVWKAPANIAMAMVKTPDLLLDETEQSMLQEGGQARNPINAIRLFPGKGTVVWGARTFAGHDNEWKYISVRRFITMIETSVQRATERFVFEANNISTWSALKQLVENFLLLQWKAGALQGRKPEEAFFVHIGLGSSMTQEDINEGRLIIEIGMALVRPAEFMLTRILLRMQSPGT